MKSYKLLATNIHVSDIELANQIISKMHKTHFEQTDELAALRADYAKLREALENTIKAPHPTWCKSRQGKVCNCYQNAARRVLEETSHAR